MKILFISANTETVFMVPLPLGLNLVAVAARNAGHRVELLDLMGNDDAPSLIESAIERLQPDVIALSVRNIDNQNMTQPRWFLPPVRDMVACCRRHSGAPIIAGGAGFSIFPEAALRYLEVDMGIRGEGETAMVRLLDALERGEDPARVPGICLPGRITAQCAERTPLAALPLPDPDLWRAPDQAGQEIWVPFQTRRGCPMRCGYCSTPALEGTVIRKHPLEEVVDCLSRHVARGFDRFYFVDNVFNLPPDYALRLCAALREAGLGIRWRCILYPGFVDEALIRNMEAAGCVEVSLGFESGNLNILRSMNKKFTPEQVRNASRLLASHGIRTNGFLLLGGPGETRETVAESLAFADSLSLDTLKVTAGIRLYPHTPLADIARREGIIKPDDDLLIPRFYLADGLEGWLQRTVEEWAAERPCLVT